MRYLKHVAPIVVAALTVAGCGGGTAGPKTGQVSGTVTYKGTPVADATVVFYPTQGPVATGVTDASGKFQLMTNKPGDGAALGMCKVTVTVNAPVPESDPASVEKAQKEAEQNAKIPKKYNAAESSGLSFEVKAGQNDAKLELTD